MNAQTYIQPDLFEGLTTEAVPTKTESPKLPQVRRFEMGASGIVIEGASVQPIGSWYKVHWQGRKGRPKTVTQAQLTEMVDEARIAKGLEPIVKR